MMTSAPPLIPAHYGYSACSFAGSIMRPRSFGRISASSILLLAVCAAGSAADVTSTGAKGDGQADDTNAIQRAVDAGGTVRFPAGTYRLTRTIAGNSLDRAAEVGAGTGISRDNDVLPRSVG